MGAELYVVWCDAGEKAGVPGSALEAILTANIAGKAGATWTLRYPEGSCDAFLQGDGERVTCLSIDRPCDAPALWSGLHAVMKVGNGLCFWSGGPAAVVADASASRHVPRDMLDDGEPVVVLDGHQLRALVLET